ncbi:hypothetical protein GALMADRAFT_1236393 [Galerina marginata CBS 339.88]|uniref:Uncharacterized protein n=1 Tax=Galerina marginata (strain CBS 339.88) TaxID=685588 RepID=A0A067TK78_GALM3|nr:hypothetical protein GALMADRAFT_1236393 [Galerina marginata CBS 339.88]
MNTQTKIVFPPPPPTFNELSAQQRAQLVRKTRKIEQLLGTAPRLVDTSLQSSPIHLTFSYDSSHRRLTKRRVSVDSTSSGSSYGSPPSPDSPQRTSSLSSNFCSIRTRKSSRSSTSSISSMYSIESRPHDNSAPLLRLAMESLTLDTIPASPDPTQSAFADTAPQARRHSRSSSREEAPCSVFPLTPKEISSPRNSLVSSIVIASPNSLRKQKMDRLRKKLGTGVPSDLVFPNEKNTGRSENTPLAASLDLEKECPPLPPPISRPTKRRIASSRDSISDTVSIHRARRQGHTSSAAKQGLKHKKTRSAPALPTSPNTDHKRLKEKLSFIIESPDEHGLGCAEQFGHSSVSNHDTDMATGWFVSSHETEIKFWSTRRGYEGWNKLAPISTYSLSSSDDDSSIYFTSPFDSASPESSPSPVSPISPTSLSDSEPKKRPSSYRKPPPLFIPSDAC